MRYESVASIDSCQMILINPMSPLGPSGRSSGRWNPWHYFLLEAFQKVHSPPYSACGGCGGHTPARQPNHNGCNVLPSPSSLRHSSTSTPRCYIMHLMHPPRHKMHSQVQVFHSKHTFISPKQPAHHTTDKPNQVFLQLSHALSGCLSVCLESASTPALLPRTPRAPFVPF